MKKGITDLVQRLSGWGEVPEYEILEIADNGDNFSIVVKKEEAYNECAGNCKEHKEDL